VTEVLRAEFDAAAVELCARAKTGTNATSENVSRPSRTEIHGVAFADYVMSIEVPKVVNLFKNLSIIGRE
jgi:hypothetical protein